LVANVAVGGSYTPAAAELDMTVAGTETFTVTTDFGCESAPTTVTVDIVNSATLVIDPVTICESGGVVDLTTLITESPTGGAFVFAGHFSFDNHRNCNNYCTCCRSDYLRSEC
jgi:hypothetical protein